MILVDSPNVAYPRGVYLELHPSGDYLSDVVRTTGDFYEPAVLDEIRRRVTGGVLIDVGAHIGNHTAYLAAFVPHIAIYAFEPVPENRALLMRNTAGYPTVHVSGHALWSDYRRVQMKVESGNFGHAVAVADASSEVPTIPLDALELDDVSLIKIDVEGREPEVLAGARDTIARCKPLIVIEDWTRTYGALLPGYRMAAEWEQTHQTFLYEAIA